MANLVSLPADVFGQILGYNDISYQAIGLWRCGNRLLQRKIELGISCIDLKSGNPFTNRQLPQLLNKLDSLKEFSLHAHDIILLSPWPIVETITSILKTLTILKIDFYWGLQIDDSASSIYQELHPTTPKDALVRDSLIGPLFKSLSKSQCLTTLELGDRLKIELDDLQLLPSSLTSLSIPGFLFEGFYGDIVVFPPSLLSLVVTLRMDADAMVFVEALPPNLTHLDTNINCVFDIQHFVALPPTLTSLHGPFLVVCPTELAAVFPLNLKNLSIASRFLVLDDMKFPTQLTSLMLHGQALLSNESVLSLPRSLTLLEAIFAPDIAKNSWPPNLQDLICSLDGPVPATFIASLPNLTSLSTNSTSNASSFSLLPASLRSIALHVDGEISSTTKFPPSLTSIQLFDYSANCSFPLSIIPESVIYLQLSPYAITATDMVHLPPKLISLSFGKLKMTNINDKDPNLLARAQYLRQVGIDCGCDMREKNGAPVLSAHLSSVQAFDLLPRTLETLEFTSNTAPHLLSSEGWSRLPSLTYLSLGMPCGASTLLHIPAHRLKTLIVRDELEDEHAKWLPRGLKGLLSGRPQTFPQVGDAFIRNAPYAIESFWASGPLSSAKKLRKARTIAFASKDRSELNSLID